MARKNQNWEPQIKNQMKGIKKPKNLGIDANSDDRFNSMGKTLKKKRKIGKTIVLLIVFLLLFGTFFSEGELLKNIIKNLLGN